MKNVLILTLQLAPFVAVMLVFVLFALGVVLWPNRQKQ